MMQVVLRGQKENTVRSKLGKLLGVAAVAIALTLSFAPAGAKAADEATNYRVQYLTATPYSGMDGAVKERRIWLASGNYIWGQVHPGNSGRQRTIYLGAGWYTWRDFLVPDSGPFSNEVDGYYHHYTVLDPDNANWATVQIYSVSVFYNHGTHRWGSYLLPQF